MYLAQKVRLDKALKILFNPPHGADQYATALQRLASHEQNEVNWNDDISTKPLEAQRTELLGRTSDKSAAEAFEFFTRQEETQEKIGRDLRATINPITPMVGLDAKATEGMLQRLQRFEDLSVEVNSLIVQGKALEAMQILHNTAADDPKRKDDEQIREFRATLRSSAAMQAAERAVNLHKLNRIARVIGEAAETAQAAHALGANVTSAVQTMTKAAEMLEAAGYKSAAAGLRDAGGKIESAQAGGSSMPEAVKDAAAKVEAARLLTLIPPKERVTQMAVEFSQRLHAIEDALTATEGHQRVDGDFDALKKLRARSEMAVELENLGKNALPAIKNTYEELQRPRGASGAGNKQQPKGAEKKRSNDASRGQLAEAERALNEVTAALAQDKDPSLAANLRQVATHIRAAADSMKDDKYEKASASFSSALGLIETTLTAGGGNGTAMIEAVSQALTAAQALHSDFTSKVLQEAQGLFLQAKKDVDALPSDVDERLAFTRLQRTLDQAGLYQFRTNERGEPVFEVQPGGSGVPADLTTEPIRVNSIVTTRPYPSKISWDRQAGRQHRSKAVVELPNGQRKTVEVESRLHLVMDPSWVEKRLIPDTRPLAVRILNPIPPRYQLFLKKGLYTEEDGLHPVLVEYADPVFVGYDDHYFTWGDDRDDGLQLERYLDTPGNYSPVEARLKDKTETRLIGALNGLPVPQSLVFVLPTHSRRAEILDLSDEVRRVASGTVRAIVLPETREAVRDAVESFLETYKGPEIIVKASSPRFRANRGVYAYQRTQVEKIVDHIMYLKNHKYMSKDGTILVDGRILGPDIYVNETGGYRASDKFGIKGGAKVGLEYLTPNQIDTVNKKGTKHNYLHGANFRAWGYRMPNGEPQAALSVVRVGGLGQFDGNKLRDQTIKMVTFDDWAHAVRTQYNIPQEDLDLLRQELLNAAKKFVSLIGDYQDRIQPKEGQPYNDRSDVIGLDAMAEETIVGGKRRFLVKTANTIEVNGHDAANQHETDLQTADGRIGEHSWARINMITERSLAYTLAGSGIKVIEHQPAPYEPYTPSQVQPPTKLVVGLGNHRYKPGRNYRDSRHNLGSKVLSRLAGVEPSDPAWKPFKDAEGNVLMHYMERGGVIFARAMDFYDNIGPILWRFAQARGIRPSEMLLLYDELRQPFAKSAFQAFGSDNGNQGLISIFQTYNRFDGFPRISIGIEPSDQLTRDTLNAALRQKDGGVISEFFVKPMIEAELAAMDPALELAAGLARSVIDYGVAEAARLSRAAEPSRTTPAPPASAPK